MAQQTEGRPQLALWLVDWFELLSSVYSAEAKSWRATDFQDGSRGANSCYTMADNTVNGLMSTGDRKARHMI